MDKPRKIQNYQPLSNGRILCENRELNVKMKRLRQKDNYMVEYYQCSKSAIDNETGQCIRCTFSGKVSYHSQRKKPFLLEIIREHLTHKEIPVKDKPSEEKTIRMRKRIKKRSTVIGNRRYNGGWTTRRKRRSIGPDVATRGRKSKKVCRCIRTSSNVDREIICTFTHPQRNFFYTLTILNSNKPIDDGNQSDFIDINH